ncbi:Pentatricopeptide repeat-containing protein, chloroplastic [Symbiodinium microadriaticum]|uniref:Pentatricopeptide repeat-containing protein, chloroplastic n=1 Tax=Symbiodinium microadriaticum TaxID=2951 RepID=A0A1Q9CUY6_SYMMI|nr:Pentatricopeptide repeat-containing protein, chloroplastic [Symbiodinium microadriaticum]
MVESQEQNASRLSLLQRHREARERLAEVSKLQGQSQAGSEVDGSHGVPLAAPSPTTDAPKSASAAACFSHAQSQEVLAASIAAASSHFHSSPLQTPLAPSSSGASKASLPRKRPLSAFPSRATASPVCQRPASAGVRERVTQAQDGDASLWRPEGKGHETAKAGQSSDAAKLMEHLPIQGPDLVLSAIQGRFGPPPPLPPLPPELAQKEPSPESQTAASRQDEDDFTAEERRLEQQSEEALNQLEALDAAVDALRFKLEVSRDDLESSGAELQQLRCAAESWAKAAEESRRELRDREQRLEELLAVLPVEEAFGPSEEKEPHKSTLADERVCVLGKQTDRLQEQVLCQQRLLAERLEERRALEAQLEGLVRDRDEQKSVQQKARGALRSTEAQLKVKEEELATASRRCQDLQHHSVRMRGEVRGLKARLAVETNIFHFSSAISACERAANWLMALDTLHAMVRHEVLPNLVSYCSSVSACEKASEWLVALGLFAEMRPRQVIPNVIAFSSAISACGKGGEWQQALQLFATMAANEVCQDVVSCASMISAAAQGGQWRLAVDVLRLMINDQITPNVVSYNSAISACERGRQWKPALQLLKSMGEATKSPDVVSYSAAISACANVGEWQRALSLLTRMGQKKVTPNTVSFNATISAAEKAQDWLLALDLLSMMRRAKVLPSVVTFSSAISACVKALEWQASLELLSAMPALKVVPNQITYNSAISACDVGSQWRQAAALLDCMLDVSIAQDELSYSAAISAASRCGQWMHGLALLAEMPQRSVRCDAVARDASLRASVKAQKWQAALLLLHVVPDTVLGCSLVLDGCEVVVAYMVMFLHACEPAADTHNKAPAPEPGDEAKGSEQRRRISLRLQHEVVELWKALQKCKEEAACLKEPTDRSCRAVVKSDLLELFLSAPYRTITSGVMTSFLEACGCEMSEDSSGHEELPPGCEDVPGYAPLPKMSPFLSCGNQYSAAHGNFAQVISTVTPRNVDGKPNPQLSTHKVFFDDQHGHESESALAHAKKLILEGAALVRQAVAAQQRTLVHCEWGQNRSGSICCAFAVLYLGWSAEDAVRYFRDQNLVERHYQGQHPMSNAGFNNLLKEIESQRSQLLGHVAPLAPPPKIIVSGGPRMGGGIERFTNASEIRPHQFQLSVSGPAGVRPCTALAGHPPKLTPASRCFTPARV